MALIIVPSYFVRAQRERGLLGRLQSKNSWAIANLKKNLLSQHGQRNLNRDCQSQKKIKKAEKPSAEKNVGQSWIFSASDEYLAILDKAGVIPLHRTYKINDHARAWAD